MYHESSFCSKAQKALLTFLTNKLLFGLAGFVTSKIACCGQGPFNGLGLCTPASNLCPNREVYAFWDSFHPSERADKIIVQQILRGTAEYMHATKLTTITALETMT